VKFVQTATVAPPQTTTATTPATATSAAPSTETSYSADTRTIYAWGIGGMADACLYLMFANILAVFTTGFKMRPELVSWALVLPRVVDGVLDPILGHFSDNLRTRWGRRRPIIFVTAIAGAVVSTALWWPSREWNEYVMFAYLITCSTLLFSLWGTYSMSHTALGYELSDDYHVRTKVIAVRQMCFSVVASLIGGWVYWLALRPAFGDEITGMRWVSAGWAVIILMTGLTPVFTCTERLQHPRRAHVPLRQALSAVLRNKSMRLMVIFRICQTLGGALNGYMGFFITTYSVCGGDKSLATSLAGYAGWIGCGWTFLLMPFAKQISQKFGKRQAILLSVSVGALGAILLPFVQSPGHPYWILVYGFVLGPANVIGGLFLGAIVPDLCDMDELEHGERREGLISAVLQFINKAEISICVLVSGYLLASTGFNAKLDQQPQEVLDKMRLLAYTPMIFFSIVCVLIARKFPFTEELMADVRIRLNERKARKQSAA
jgi:GPH family glycoside/pentoside/hexuronide:cation symporter